MSTYTPRPSSPRPPTFPAGAPVAFDYAGQTVTGIFLRRFKQAARDAWNYEIEVDGTAHLIAANGPTGRTVRVVR